MRTVADMIAHFLAEKGVTHAFGIIGAGNAALFEAIARHAKTEIVCCHHEAAAAMAATYWGRTRASCGVAIVTTGAGSSNAITGALAAQMDSAPLLVLSGNEPLKYLSGPKTRIAGVQGFWTQDAVKPFVKSAKMGDASRIRMGLLQRAWDEALQVRPGAVWIDFPRDQFNALV
jgi:acetolactate synthase I/II/III large subunit